MKKLTNFIFILVIVLLFFLIWSRFYGSHNSDLTAEEAMDKQPVDLIEQVEVSITPEQKQEILGKIQELEAAIAQDPSEGENYLSLGIFYESLGDLRKARDNYELAVQVMPDSFKPYANLAAISKTMGDYATAENNYNIAIQKNPAGVNLYINLAELYEYYFDKDILFINKVYKNGLEATGNHIDLLKMYSNFLERNEQYEEAIMNWNTILAQEPEDRHGPILIKLGELKEKRQAQKQAEQAE